MKITREMLAEQNEALREQLSDRQRIIFELGANMATVMTICRTMQNDLEELTKDGSDAE